MGMKTRTSSYQTDPLYVYEEYTLCVLISDGPHDKMTHPDLRSFAAGGASHAGVEPSPWHAAPLEHTPLTKSRPRPPGGSPPRRSPNKICGGQYDIIHYFYMISDITGFSGFRGAVRGQCTSGVQEDGGGIMIRMDGEARCSGKSEGKVNVNNDGDGGGDDVGGGRR
jgi:hypothetical protein